MMEYKDEHYCVVCCRTIYGLMNYVVHRKNGCEPPEKKIKVASPPNFPVNTRSNSKQDSKPHEDDGFIQHVTETCRQSDADTENHPSMLTDHEKTTETSREGGDCSVSSALDLSCQNEKNQVPHEREPCSENSSRNVDEVCTKVNNELNTDAETVASFTDVFKNLNTDVEIVASSFTDGECLGHQINNNIDCQTSRALTLPVVRDDDNEGLLNAKQKEYGLLSVCVIESQDKTWDVPDIAKKGKKRKRSTTGPKCKASTQPSAHCSYDTEAYTKLQNTGLPNVEVDVTNTGKPSDNVVGESTNVANGIENDSEDNINIVIKSEQQQSDSEADDTADIDGTRENGFKHLGDCKQGDGSDEKATSMSGTEGNTSFSCSKECKACDLKFESRSSLLKHLLTDVSKDGTTENIHEFLALKYLSYFSHRSPFQCGVCKFYCSRLDDFQCHLKSSNHMSNSRNIQTELRCKPCNIIFSIHEDLNQHFHDFMHNESEDIVHVEAVNPNRVKDNFIHNESEDILQVVAIHPNGIKDNLDKCSMSSRTERNMGQPANSDYSEMLTKHSDALCPDTDTEMDTENDVMGETEIKVDPDDDIVGCMGNTCAETYVTGEKYEVDEGTVRFDGELTELPKSRKRVKTSNSRTKNQIKKTLQCKHCMFTCDIDADMKFHYLDQHIELTHKCDICDIVFLTRGNYGKHTHSKEHQSNIEKLGPNQSSQMFYTCHVCEKKFTSENYCKFHTARQHFHLKSEDCLLKLPSITRDKYADYLATIANEFSKTRCKCPECGSMVSKNGMMAHLRLHTGEQPFQCKLCVQSFVNQTSLRRHLGVHFNIFSKSCEICGQQFRRIEHYNNHLLLHKSVEIDSKTHVCEICGTSFFLAKQLRAHLYKHQEKTLKCDQPGCKWSFHNKHDLKMHKLTHSSDENAFICATCGFTAKCKKYLKAHEKIHAKDVPLLECQFCEYKARKNTHMRRHMRIHLGSKPYKCPYCSYACNTHDNIRKHILETNIHLGMKVYPCKFCEYATNSTKDFRSHLMADHSDLVEDGARSRSLSSFTGLFIESEDLTVAEEGMPILPVVRRKNSRRSFKPELEITD